MTLALFALLPDACVLTVEMDIDSISLALSHPLAHNPFVANWKTTAFIDRSGVLFPEYIFHRGLQR